MVNAIFDNRSDDEEALAIDVVAVSNLDAAPPADYDPDGLGSFTFVYGKGAQYQGQPVQGRSRRRLGSTYQGPGLKDYTVFTINW